MNETINKLLNIHLWNFTLPKDKFQIHTQITALQIPWHGLTYFNNNVAKTEHAARPGEIHDRGKRVQYDQYEPDDTVAA